MKIPRFLIVACISMTDLVFCITMFVSYIIAAPYPEGTICEMVSESGAFFAHITFHMSLALSMLMSVNQLLTIHYGMIYNAIVTCHRVRIVIAVMLFFVTLINILALLDNDIRKVIHLKMRRSRIIVNTSMAWLCVLCMIINVAKGYQTSQEQMTKLPTDLPYWSKRKRIRCEITTLSLIKVIVLVPLGVFYPKLMFINDPEVDKYTMRVARLLLLIFCTWNAVLYMTTFKELRKSVIQIFQREKTQAVRKSPARACTIHMRKSSANNQDMREMTSYNPKSNQAYTREDTKVEKI